MNLLVCLFVYLSMFTSGCLSAGLSRTAFGYNVPTLSQMQLLTQSLTTTLQKVVPYLTPWGWGGVKWGGRKIREGVEGQMLSGNTESPIKLTCKPQIPKQAPSDGGMRVHPAGDCHSTHVQQIHKISKPS